MSKHPELFKTLGIVLKDGRVIEGIADSYQVEHDQIIDLITGMVQREEARYLSIEGFSPINADDTINSKDIVDVQLIIRPTQKDG